MQPEITEDQLKSLKLFAIYCQGYGADEVNYTIYTMNCEEDWRDDSFYPTNGVSSIEGYDRINEVLDQIIDQNELFENSVTDCENRGQLMFNIDCKERTLTINAWEWQYGSNESSASWTLEELKKDDENYYNEVVRVFEMLGDDRTASVSFEGSGDSGSLENYMDIEGQSEDISAGLEDLLYRLLASHYDGWENNEGASGDFIFNPSDGEIQLEFLENTEEEVSVPLNFTIKF
jgi:hypothetical protein